MSSTSCLGFFTLVQKGLADDDENNSSNSSNSSNNPSCETVAKLKHVLTKEYSAMKKKNEQEMDETMVMMMPKKTYELQIPEPSHVEVLHVLAQQDKSHTAAITSRDIVAALHSGRILIPQVHPYHHHHSSCKGGGPDAEDPKDDHHTVVLPRNWPLQFVYQQLVDYFQRHHQSSSAACESCLKAIRMLQMRTPEEEAQYFAASDRAFQHWKLKGNEPLERPENLIDKEMEQQQLQQQQQQQQGAESAGRIGGCGGGTFSILDALDHFLTPIPESHQIKSPSTKVEDETAAWSVDALVESVNELLTPVPEPSDIFEHGLLLFTDCYNSTHHFQPNFLPPYCRNKRQIIRDVMFTTGTGNIVKPIPALTIPKKRLPTIIQCGHHHNKKGAAAAKTAVRRYSFSSSEVSWSSSTKKKQGATPVTAGDNTLLDNHPTNHGNNSPKRQNLRQKFTKLFLRTNDDQN